MEQDAKNENRLVGIDLACIYKQAGPRTTLSGRAQMMSVMDVLPLTCGC